MAILPFTIQLSYAGTPAGTITYNAGTDTITVSGANSTHPAEFLDLYNADVAGGWSQVTTQGTNQFLFSCKIVFGDGQNTTYFKDTAKQVTFSNGIMSAWAYLMEAKNATYIQFGEAVNYQYSTVQKGVDFYSLESDSGYLFYQNAAWNNIGNVSFFGCSFRSTALSYVSLGYSVKVFGSFFGYTVGLIISSSYGEGTSVIDVVSETKSSSAGAALDVRSDSNLTNFQHKGTGTVIYTKFGVNFTVSGCYARNFSKLFYDDRFTGNAYLKDFDVDIWSVGFQDDRSTGEVWRQYSFDLYVLNGALTDFVEDANVTLTHDGTVYGSWLSNSTGQIDTQTLTYGFYNQTGGNTMYGGTAWTLTITHPDWETYTSAFYPYSEIDWSISMQDTSTSNNNMLLVGLLVGSVAFLGLIVIRRKTT